MKGINYTQPFLLTEGQALEVYATVLDRPVEEVRRFLYDVEDLSGKVPDGAFDRVLSREDEAVLDGFTGDSMKAYLEVLDGNVRERIGDYLVGEAWFPEAKRLKIIRHKPSSYREMYLCRELSIADTINRLIGGFEPEWKNPWERPHSNGPGGKRHQ